MAINSEKNFKDPELQNIKRQIEQIPNVSNIPENEYLTKAQKRFAAVEWEQQIYFQLFCAKHSSVTIDDIKYNAQTVGDKAERDMGNKEAIWNRLYNSYLRNMALMFIDENDMKDEKKLEEFGNRILEMKKIVDDADAEYFSTCALYFYGIPKDKALLNKEMLVPYVIGRKYYHSKAFVGSAFNDIQKGKSTEQVNSLDTIFSGLTKDHY
jgi:hypothetical protein